MPTHFISLLLTASLVLMPLGINIAKPVEDKADHKPLIAGWLEYVVLESWPVKFRAKLDTGAKTSSLHAVDIERFQRDGQPWIRFSTEDKKSNTKVKPVELPVKREVKIKSHRNDAAVRPVVEMHFCLKGNVYQSEFSLVDRSRFNYPVLLGRRILKHGIIVDASATFTLPIDQQHCERLLENVR
jgi:hypothetical protein